MGIGCTESKSGPKIYGLKPSALLISMV